MTDSIGMAGYRLLKFVCMPLALFVLVFNLRSYPALVGDGHHASNHAMSSVRQQNAMRHSAFRALSRRRARASTSSSNEVDAAHSSWHPVDVSERDGGGGDEEDEEEVRDEEAEGEEPEETGGESAAADTGRGDEEAAGGANPHGEAASSEKASTGSTLQTVLTSVVKSAIGTANAAAAVVARVSDRLRAAALHGDCKPREPNWAQRPLNFVAPVEADEWPVACTSRAVVAAGGEALCAALAKVAKHREAVVTLLETSDDGSALDAFLRAAPKQVIVLTAADGLAPRSALGLEGVAFVPLPEETRALPSLARKYAAFEGVLRAGCSAFFAHVSSQWSEGAGAFGYLYRDVDIEAVATQSGFLTRGRVVSVDDAQMGWSRYAQSLAISALNPNFFYASATGEAAAMMAFLHRRFSPLGGAGGATPTTPGSEAYEFTVEAIGPAHDGKRSAGVSLRLLSSNCFGTGRGSVASVERPGASGSEGGSAWGGNSNAILASRQFDARAQVLKQGCAKVAPPADSPPARPLNYVVPPTASEWPHAANCASMGLESLCEVVQAIGSERREVLAAVSNKNIFHMLQLFVNGIKAANVSNAMVVALDDATDAWLAERNVHRYKKKLVSRTGSTDNHATSGLKFKILVDFLSIGCSVLLSDVDVIWLQNPFPFLYRDTDVEGMTDGWDEPTSYGYDYGAGSVRVFARNSGMFYLQATHQANEMMKRLARRMETEGTWDQTAYNEEQFYPAYDAHATVGVSSRVMNYLCNLNSKTFFRFLREDAPLLKGFRPVSVHVNYHPEKPNRMVDLHAWYYLGDDQRGEKAGIWKWNGGEGSRLMAECKAAVRPGAPSSSKPLIQQILLAGKAEWGGIKWIEFGADGSLKTPWGNGKWGDASSAKRPNTVYADFIGQLHMLTFTGSSYESMRCSDGETIKGSLAAAGTA